MGVVKISGFNFTMNCALPLAVTGLDMPLATWPPLVVLSEDVVVIGGKKNTIPLIQFLLLPQDTVYIIYT